MPYYRCPHCKKRTFHLEHFLNALDLYEGKRKMQCILCGKSRVINMFKEFESPDEIEKLNPE